MLVLPGPRGGESRSQCAAAAALLERTGATALECDASAITGPDLDTVEILGRLKLTAIRADRSFRVTHTSVALMDLLRLTGLDEAFRATGVHRPSAYTHRPRPARTGRHQLDAAKRPQPDLMSRPVPRKEN